MSAQSNNRAFIRTLSKIKKRLLKRKYKCLYPSCTKAAVQSHSQQKEGQLRAIAKDGNVYALRHSTLPASKALTPKDVIEMKKIGLSEASTFPGFCSKHDSQIFQPIEQSKLKANNEEQALLLFLRSIVYEYAQKRRSFEWFTESLESMKHHLKPSGRELAETWSAGLKWFVEADAPFYLGKVFEAYDNRDYSIINTAWKVIEKNVNASCSCVFSPLKENHEQYMRQNFDQPQPAMTFSMVPEVKRTHIVISWLRWHDALTDWVWQHVRSIAVLEKLINHIAFAESEDTCINPDLWERASPDLKKSILHAMRHEVFRGPLESDPILITL